MEEESGGILHIIFIFIGVALLSVGIFYSLTDEKIKLRGTDNTEGNTGTNTNTNNDDDKDIIEKINLTPNEETKITLKNGKEVTLEYVKETTGLFNYNGLTLFDTNETETCDLFYLYNNSIIAYCGFNTISYGHMYIINSKGISNSYYNFQNDDGRYYVPGAITLKDEKLIIDGIGALEGGVITVGDRQLYLCSEEDRKYNNLSDNFPVNSIFELVINDDEVEFVYQSTSKTLKEFIKESCKTVEDE